MVAPTNASKWRMGFNSAFKGLRNVRLVRGSSSFPKIKEPPADSSTREGWLEAGSFVRSHSSGVKFELHCYVVSSALCI